MDNINELKNKVDELKNVLILGYTGRGKSTLIHNIIADKESKSSNLLYYVYDSKVVEYSRYKKTIKDRFNYFTDISQFEESLNKIVDEKENEKNIIIIADDYGEIVLSKNKSINKKLAKLMSEKRTNIQIVLASQIAISFSKELLINADNLINLGASLPDEKMFLKYKKN